MPYQSVTSERLQLFLDRLAWEHRQPGRIYLVGGTGLLYQGHKASTKDVDLSPQLPQADYDSFTQILRRLSNELQMAIEGVSPADFIPLPSGTEFRHVYLVRKGTLDIYAFDLIATALAKLVRSRAADITDVIALLDAQQLRLDVLIAAFGEILPRVEAGEALKIKPEEYQQKFSAFVELVRQRGLK